MSIKKAVLKVAGSLAVVCAMGMSAPVFAYDYWVSSPGNLNGTSTVTGPTTAIYNGLAVPCTSSFTVKDTAGSGSVIAASFSGSGTCAAITACNLPWPIGKPTNASGVVTNTQIGTAASPACVSIPFPGGTQTCRGIANGTLTNPSPNTFTFTGSFTATPGPGTCTVRSTGSLTPSPALGIQ